MDIANNLELAEIATKKNTNEEYPFSVEEMKWASQSMADFYAKFEKGEAKPFKARG